jgi:hypothetical protein
MLLLIMKTNVGHINFQPEVNWVIKPRQLSANSYLADKFKSIDAILKPMQPAPYILDEIMHDPTQMDIGHNNFCGRFVLKRQQEYYIYFNIVCTNGKIDQSTEASYEHYIIRRY